MHPRKNARIIFFPRTLATPTVPRCRLAARPWNRECIEQEREEKGLHEKKKKKKKEAKEKEGGWGAAEGAELGEKRSEKDRRWRERERERERKGGEGWVKSTSSSCLGSNMSRAQPLSTTLSLIPVLAVLSFSPEHSVRTYVRTCALFSAA